MGGCNTALELQNDASLEMKNEMYQWAVPLQNPSAPAGVEVVLLGVHRCESGYFQGKGRGWSIRTSEGAADRDKSG